MDPENQKPKEYSVSPEDLARIKDFRNKQEKIYPQIDDEWLVIAEFAYLYGWEAAKDVLNDNISLELVNTMILAGRKVWNSKVVDIAIANRVAVSSAMATKDPQRVFTEGLKNYLDGI